MDSQKSNDVSTLLSREEASSIKSPKKSILKKPGDFGRKPSISSRSPSKSHTYGQIVRTSRVSFVDRARNQPICTVIEIEPCIYQDPDSPKTTSCTCMAF